MQLEAQLKQSVAGFNIQALSHSINIDKDSVTDQEVLEVRLKFDKDKLCAVYPSAIFKGTEYSTALSDCDPNWVRLLSRPSVVQSLLANIGESLNSMDDDVALASEELDRLLSRQSQELCKTQLEDLGRLEAFELIGSLNSARRIIGIDNLSSLTKTAACLESVLKQLIREYREGGAKKRSLMPLFRELDSTTPLLDDLEKGINPEGATNLNETFFWGIFYGLANLRNQRSDSHGNDPAAKDDYFVKDHHARFANQLATVVSIFLLQEHQEHLKKVKSDGCDAG